MFKYHTLPFSRGSAISYFFYYLVSNIPSYSLLFSVISVNIEAYITVSIVPPESIFHRQNYKLNILLISFILPWCRSVSVWPRCLVSLHKELLYKNWQNFLDTQYLISNGCAMCAKRNHIFHSEQFFMNIKNNHESNKRRNFPQISAAGCCRL